MVEAVGCEVGPHRTILAAIHYPLLNTAEHEVFTLEIGVGFVVYLVEVYAKTLVGLVESGIHPFIHHAPELTHLLIAGLPATQHLAGLLHEGRGSLGLLIGHTLLFEGFELGFVVLVEFHIEVADQVVTLLA